MAEVHIKRIVVASPNDVQAERNALPAVVEELNNGIARDRGVRLELARWETDASPGFHPEGPQALIDAILRIEDCDVLIGLFWKRFGTPVSDASSGTEHEFRRAYEAWQRQRRPHIMMYFNQRAYNPKTKAEAEQWAHVLAFRESFPKEGLWWPYRGKSEFERLVRTHLTQFIRQLIPHPDLKPTPLVLSPPETQVGPLEFDRSNEFIGGKSRLETFAFLLNRARRQNPAPLQVSVIHHGVSFADQRLGELEQQTMRSEEEEQEYRHLFRVKDFLTDHARPCLERAIELAVNDERLSLHTSLKFDDSLYQFLIGLRNAVFTVGTPVFWGDPENPWWILDWIRRPHEWHVWRPEDDSLHVQIKVSEEEAEWIRIKFRCDLSGTEVLPKETAFNLYALSRNTICGIALPGIVLTLVTRWPSRSLIPNAMLDLDQWVFSPETPRRAWVVPPVYSPDFHRLRDLRSPRQ